MGAFLTNDVAYGSSSSQAEISEADPEYGQYSSAEFTDLLTDYGMLQSQSRSRQCGNKAVGESRFATLKLEFVDRRSWATRAPLRGAVFARRPEG